MKATHNIQSAAVERFRYEDRVALGDCHLDDTRQSLLTPDGHNNITVDPVGRIMKLQLHLPQRLKEWRISLDMTHENVLKLIDHW